jgi:hypothetical protein
VPTFLFALHGHVLILTTAKIDGPISRPGALMAVRKGQYKLHMWTQGSHCLDGYPDQACW